MADTSDPADIPPQLRTLKQIRDEALAKRERLDRDMIAASSGPRGGSGSRGAQIDTKAKGLAWVQGSIDADYLLPKLHHLFAELLLHRVANVPPWRGEPKTDVEALEALDALLTALTVAMKPDSTATAALPVPAAQPKKLLTAWREITTALEMKYADREKVKSLNERYQGPIKNSGKGTNPMVYQEDLIQWWNKLAIQQQELANQLEGARLSAEAQHNYGSDGTAAPEIGGGVKKRRRDKRT